MTVLATLLLRRLHSGKRGGALLGDVAIDAEGGAAGAEADGDEEAGAEV